MTKTQAVSIGIGLLMLTFLRVEWTSAQIVTLFVSDIPSTSFERVEGVSSDSDGSGFIALSARSNSEPNSFEYGSRIVVFSENGEVERVVELFQSNFLKQARRLSDDSFIVAGSVRSPLSSGSRTRTDAIIAAVDGSGATLWSRVVAIPRFDSESFNHIVVLEGGRVLVFGHHNEDPRSTTSTATSFIFSTSGDSLFQVVSGGYVTKYGFSLDGGGFALGELDWNGGDEFTHSEYDANGLALSTIRFRPAIQTHDVIRPATGNFIFTGIDLADDGSLKNASVVKSYDAEGILLWTSELGSYFDYPRVRTSHVGVFNTGDVYVVGSYKADQQSPTNAMVAVLSSDGVVKAVTSLSASREEVINDVLDLHNGILVVAGSSTEGAMVKGVSIGASTDVEVAKAPSRLKNPIHVYPNPASDFLTVETGQPRSGGSLHVVDVSGRTVLSKSASDKLDISTLLPGLYFLIVESDAGRDSVPFVKR